MRKLTAAISAAAIAASVTAINDVAAMAKRGNLSVGGQKLDTSAEILSFKF